MNEEHYTFEEIVALLARDRLDRLGESALAVMERVNRLGSVAAVTAEVLQEVEQMLRDAGDEEE